MQFTNGYADATNGTSSSKMQRSLSHSEELLLVPTTTWKLRDPELFRNTELPSNNEASNWSLFLKVFVCAVSLVILLFVGVFFHKSVSQFIVQTAVTVRQSGLYGIFGFAFLTFCFCFPFIVGFGLLQSLIGFIYGFPAGIYISAPAMVLGAVCCYALFSKPKFALWARQKISKNEILHSISKIFMAHPWRMTLLCRLSALPFVSMTLLNAVMHVGYVKFLVGMIIVIFKAALHVYIGFCLSGLNGSGSTVRTLSMVMTVLLNILVGYICLRLIRRELSANLMFKAQSPLPFYY